MAAEELDVANLSVNGMALSPTIRSLVGRLTPPAIPQEALDRSRNTCHVVDLWPAS